MPLNGPSTSHRHSAISIRICAATPPHRGHDGARDPVWMTVQGDVARYFEPGKAYTLTFDQTGN